MIRSQALLVSSCALVISLPLGACSSKQKAKNSVTIEHSVEDFEACKELTAASGAKPGEHPCSAEVSDKLERDLVGFAGLTPEERDTVIENWTTTNPLGVYYLDEEARTTMSVSWTFRVVPTFRVDWPQLELSHATMSEDGSSLLLATVSDTIVVLAIDTLASAPLLDEAAAGRLEAALRDTTSSPRAKLLLGETHEFTQAWLSQDEDRVLTIAAGDNGTVMQLWDPATQAELCSVLGFTPFAVQFRSDSTLAFGVGRSGDWGAVRLDPAQVACEVLRVDVALPHMAAERPTHPWILGPDGLFSGDMELAAQTPATLDQVFVAVGDGFIPFTKEHPIFSQELNAADFAEFYHRPTLWADFLSGKSSELSEQQRGGVPFSLTQTD